MKKTITKDDFAKLIESAYPRLDRFALSICNSRDEAKDVVGETVLIAFERFGSLKDEKAFLSFLLGKVLGMILKWFLENFQFSVQNSELKNWICWQLQQLLV